jgi:hypothetical protein
VSNYFESTIKSHPSVDGYLAASLLGHEMVGKPEKVQCMYAAYFNRENQNISATLVRKFEDVVDWRKDQPWGQTEGPLRTIEKCVAIQDALHSI